MLLARSVDSRSDFLETTRDEIAKLPEKLPETNVVLYVLVSFHTRDVVCTLSRLFVKPGFRLFFVRLAVHYFAVYSVSGSRLRVQWLFKRALQYVCSFLCQNNNVKWPHSTYSRKRELYDGQLLTFLFRILKLSCIFCLRYF